MRRLRLVTPIFNDWTSFSILLKELDQLAASLPVRISVSAINDGSTLSPEEDLRDVPLLRNLESVEIIHLFCNVGHQRAIAIGLCVAVEDDDSDAILIMDADGEDPPQGIAQLLQSAGDAQDFCIVARRRKRLENTTFKISYLIYKFIFKLLTGKQIDFGNFSLLSRGYAERLVRVSDLWNNLPAAILRSRLPIRAVPIDRAKRYAGKSKMSLTSLVVHGLSGLSVYAEAIFVRLLFFTIALGCLSAISIAVVLTLRIFFPGHATPGWATTVSFGMAIILSQALSVSLCSILMLLSNRVQRLVVPVVDYKSFVDYRQTLMSSVEIDTPRFDAVENTLY